MDEDTFVGPEPGSGGPANSGPGGDVYALLGVGLAGLGLKGFGENTKYQASKDYNAASIDKIGHEQAIEQQKYQAMILMNDRQQKQNIRNVQRARSLSLTSATASGSQFGSGLKGSEAAETAQGNLNSLGLSQNLQFGKNVFGQQSAISANKISMANANLKSQEGSAYSDVGKDLLFAAPMIAKFATMLI